MIYSPKFTKVWHYILSQFHSQQVVGQYQLYSCSRAKPRGINRLADVKCSDLELVYLRYQMHALTACELPC